MKDYEFPCAPIDLTADELMVFNYILERGKRYPKCQCHYNHSITGIGTKDELIKRGLIKPEWIPGVVGKTVSSQRVLFRDVQSEGELFFGRKIRLSGLEYVLQIERRGAKYRIKETFPEPIYKKLNAQSERGYLLAKSQSDLFHAQQMEALKVARLPQSVEKAKDTLLRRSESYLYLVDDMIRNGIGGFVVKPYQREKLLEKVRELSMGIMEANFNYKPHMKDKAITAIKIETAKSDHQFQSFMTLISNGGPGNE